jgi:hypothetical protein
MRGLYLSFDTDQRPERLHDAFPGETLERLRALKAVYDPGNVFNQNFPIASLARDGAAQTPPAPGAQRPVGRAAPPGHDDLPDAPGRLDRALGR